MVRLFLAAALTVAAMLPVSRPAAAADRLQAIKQKGTIVIGVRYDAPNYGWMNPQTGKAEGLDVDLARYVGAKIVGSPDKVEIKEAGTASRIAQLQQGDVDVLFVTMIVTPERQAAIDFSNYYYPNELTFMVPEKSTFPGNLTDARGKTDCTTPGGFAHQVLLNNIAKYGITEKEAPVIYLPALAECLEALKTGRVDYMFTSKNQEQGLAKMAGGMKILNKASIFVPWAAGVAKGNPELLKAVNDAIMAAYRDGTWARLYKKWNGEDPPANWRPGGRPGS